LEFRHSPQSKLASPRQDGAPKPLWFYILREAAVCTGGLRLGPVGGSIVTEVLVGLINKDKASFREVDPEWRPRKALTELLVSVAS